MEPSEWIIIDTDGCRAIRDFSELYKTEQDKSNRMFGNILLEDFANKICKLNNIIDIDEEFFKYIIDIYLDLKIKFLLD